ncbi:MAG: hypothetical protein WD431_04080 [Cyclobacteriaceae bacterium]
MIDKAHYLVKKLKQTPIEMDADWDKPQWLEIEPLSLPYQMGPQPKFLPKVQAKLMYDDENINCIIRVEINILTKKLK